MRNIIKGWVDKLRDAFNVREKPDNFLHKLAHETADSLLEEQASVASIGRTYGKYVITCSAVRQGRTIHFTYYVGSFTRKMPMSYDMALHMMRKFA